MSSKAMKRKGRERISQDAVINLPTSASHCKKKPKKQNSFTSCATELRRSSFSKSLMQHCCVGYLLSSVPQVAGGGCGWSNTQMRYTEICGSLSSEICMSNTRRSVYSMNKLTCQHKSLPSVHTAPTWLGVSEVLACVIILKEMLDKGPFANSPPQVPQRRPPSPWHGRQR